MGSFGIDDEIDVGANVLGLGRLKLIEIKVDVAAHENQFFGVASKGTIEADRGGDVGQRSLEQKLANNSCLLHIFDVSLQRYRLRFDLDTCVLVPP